MFGFYFRPILHHSSALDVVCRMTTRNGLHMTLSPIVCSVVRKSFNEELAVENATTGTISFDRQRRSIVHANIPTMNVTLVFFATTPTVESLSVYQMIHLATHRTLTKIHVNPAKCSTKQRATEK